VRKSSNGNPLQGLIPQTSFSRFSRRLGEHRRWSQSGHKTVATSTR